MSFFKDMTLERLFIVLTALGALVLLYVGVGARSELAELKLALKTQAPAVSNQIQQLSREYSKLYEAKEGDRFQKQDSPSSYIRSCAAVAGAEIGQVSISPSTSALGNGIEDHIFRITPQDASRTFRRERIARFLYELEKGSEQIRVTSLEIRTSNNPKVQDHEIPANAWTLKATCTSRQKSKDS